MGISTFWRPELPFFWMNTITMICVIIILIVGPPFLVIYYLYRYSDWEKEEFEHKMGSVLDGFKKTNKWVLFYPVFFMIRRTVIAAQAVFQSKEFTFQVMSRILMTITQLIFLLTV